MIIDSSALLAILFQEPDAQDILDRIIAADDRKMSAATLVEAYMVALGVDEAHADGFDRIVARLEIDIVPFTLDHATFAREGFLLYGKGRHRARLNLGDTFSYGLAKATGEPLLFKGTDFTLTDITPAA